MERVTQKAHWQEEPWADVFVYGGTVLDIRSVAGGITGEGEDRVGILFLIDLPFSLCADTVLLPLTIYQQFDRRNWDEAFFLQKLDFVVDSMRWK